VPEKRTASKPAGLACRLLLPYYWLRQLFDHEDGGGCICLQKWVKFYQTTRRYIPADSRHHYENLKPKVLIEISNSPVRLVSFNQNVPHSLMAHYFSPLIPVHLSFPLLRGYCERLNHCGYIHMDPPVQPLQPNFCL
jgi:hypothetical protein